MKMQKHINLLVFVYAFGVLASSEFGYGSIVRGHWNISCAESEKQAVLLFKKSFTSDSDYLSSWVGDDCCAWHGIGCNNDRTGHVMQLDLRNGNLRGGPILPSFLDLKYLTYLDLSNNSFDSIQIPEIFGSFKDLTYLNLSHSNFRGLVPHHLGNLSCLRYLDLNYNLDYNNNYLLSIDSMGWLSRLSLLEHLDLSFVSLSSVVDWFPSVNMLHKSVAVLKLHYCQLPNNIPENVPFVNLTSLISLDLGDNHLSSSFPLWVFNNTGLAHLILGPNYFTSPIPESVGRLRSLVELDLSGNSFNGSIPESIGNLTSLTSLQLSQNNLEGIILTWIGNLESLTSLDLSQNKFQGSIAPILPLTSLNNLDVSFNNLQGLTPNSIGNLTALFTLDISYNNFHSLIPQSIGNLTSLFENFLSNNKLNDSVPPEMGKLTQLTYLDISSNELRGCLLQSFCKLSKLERLYLNRNQLSGSIPRCIGELSNLISLTLHFNSWDGFISEDHFVSLTRLTNLYISSDSNLVLNVTSDWVPPFQLLEIYMKSMKVGPKFPKWLLTQKHVRYIRMANTSITDTIPADWFVSVLLSNAYSIDLSNNQFRGELS